MSAAEEGAERPANPLGAGAAPRRGEAEPRAPIGAALLRTPETDCHESFRLGPRVFVEKEEARAPPISDDNQFSLAGLSEEGARMLAVLQDIIGTEFAIRMEDACRQASPGAQAGIIAALRAARAAALQGAAQKVKAETSGKLHDAMIALRSRRGAKPNRRARRADIG